MARKFIETQQADALISGLKKELRFLSLTDFIREYYSVLHESKKTAREIYDYLSGHGIDIGTFKTFSNLYSRAGNEFRKKNAIQNSVAPVVPQPRNQEPEKAISPEATPEKKKYNPACPPIFLPNGTEIEIDPETGAKTFKIKGKGSD